MKQRMLAGELYRADDGELTAERVRAQELCAAYNATGPAQRAERDAILHRLLGAAADGVVIEPAFHCDYGAPIRIGARTFVNYDCVMLDAAPITIGEDCQLAPRVQLLTATHPVDPVARREGWESALPITLGDAVWLGAGVIVCPGVSIGAGTVVGAGAVVTRDLAPGVVAHGNPARAARPITDADRVAPPEA